MQYFKFAPHILLALAASLLCASCGSSTPDEPETEQAGTTTATTVPVKVESATWQAQAGEDAYEGKIAFVNRTGGKLHIQLVNDDAVNLAMRFPEEGAQAHKVEDAFFALSRKQPCRLVTSEPPYQVTLEPGGGDSLNGTFAGMLGCPDYSALPVKGSFQIALAGEQR
jgi:hypothetical protein